MEKSDYCTGTKDVNEECSFRNEEYLIKRLGFCSLGYNQNPRTREATVNALLNGAEVCRFNQFRAGVRADLRLLGNLGDLVLTDEAD